MMPLLAAAALGPAFVLAGLATGAWVPLLLAALVAAAAAWSLHDARSAILVALFLGSFVDYNTGLLTLELAIICAWLAWTALVLLWRSAWTGWIAPPKELLAPIGVWLVALALGAGVGLFRGQNLQNMGLEIAAALWPLGAIGIVQTFGRRSLGYAAIGLVAIALVHTVFGITMLWSYQQRLGGIYFTPITGIAAIGLWTASLLAPERRVRILCLAAMVPLLAHLFLSFTRGYWLGFIAGILLATLLAWRSLGRTDPGVRLRRLLLLPALATLTACAIGLAALGFGGTDLLAAAGGRFESSFSTEMGGATLSNLIRLDEYDRAIGAALESPVVGQGLGYSFVTRDLLTRTMKDQWYVHEYYLWLWLKIGLVGLAAFAFLIVRFLRAARHVAAGDDSWGARVWAVATLGVTAQVLVILLTNYSLADLTTASVFAFVWGVLWAIRGEGGARAAAPAAA